MSEKVFQTTCCVVGGGPAGIMLGYLLAKAGVAVTVLEKHKDFFRDFRGDTVHPSTLELLHELGLLEEFLKLPHQEFRSIGGIFGDYPFQAADFSHLPTRCRFVAVMPQWDFLDFLSEHARKYQTFDLRMEHEAVDLIRENGRVKGVLVRTAQGNEEIRADLVIGCDGRHSTTRAAAQLPVHEVGVPIDVLWFRISRRPDDAEHGFGYVNYGRALVLINRGDYFQTALLIRKNSFEQFKSQGIEKLRETVARIAPFLNDRIGELKDWDQVKLLSVQINRLKRWHQPGLLCIGDAAHAMSPVFGVGINLAIQDAVATANLLASALKKREITDGLLENIQRRREFPTRVTQFLQMLAHRGIQHVFERQGPITAPWQFKAVTSIPGLPLVNARIIAVGVRPEHVAGTRRRSQNVNAVRASVAILTGLAVGITIAWHGFANKRT